jgi:hypothetical protein
MAEADRDTILSAVRQLAAENGGVPLGRQRFEERTGIYEARWLGRYWTSWSALVREAGFEPNSMNVALDDDYALGHFASLVRELGSWPTRAQRKFKRTSDPTFPSAGAFDRFGRKIDLARRVLDYCESRGDLSDVADICRGLLPDEEEEQSGETVRNGFVYLMKSGPHYKIGLSNDVGRRVYELGILLPQPLRLVHSFETDDPRGIEAYWHERFKGKRLNGEWFKLSKADVAAFRRRKRFM